MWYRGVFTPGGFSYKRLGCVLVLSITPGVSACSANPVSPVPNPALYSYQFASAPIASIALDDYASGGWLTVPAGTEFGLELAGGGWTFPPPDDRNLFRLLKGPGSWFPDTGFLGPGNCDSASPCGGDGAVFTASGSGYGDVIAINALGKSVFDLHLVVKPGPISLDLQALPIPTEALGTGVTLPVGSSVNVQLIGNWAPPTPDTVVNDLFARGHRATSGVVTLVGTGHVFGETVYSYSITGKGGYAYEFKYLDPSPFSNGYTIGFDIA
jgi:hypothetical protein